MIKKTEIKKTNDETKVVENCKKWKCGCGSCESCKFRNYFVDFSNTPIADHLLWFFHVIAQIFTFLSMIFTIITCIVFSNVFWLNAAVVWFITLIFTPIVSLAIRFWFECLSAFFGATKNLKEINQKMK